MSPRRSSNASPLLGDVPVSKPASPGSRPSRRAAGRKAALLAYFTSPPPEARAMDAAWDEALALYGDEGSDAWIAALEDGTHPLCRVRSPQRSA